MPRMVYDYATGRYRPLPPQGPTWSWWWLGWAFILFWPTIAWHSATVRVLVEVPWIALVIAASVWVHRRGKRRT